MAGLVLDKLSRVFGSQVHDGGLRAVDRLSLDVADGELLVLVGPSGCGKTTTLRLIAGLDTPDEGDVRIGERSVGKLAPRERDIAMVFQRPALYPHLSVRQNLALGVEWREKRGWWQRNWQKRDSSGQPLAERIAEAVDWLGLEGLVDRKPRELSGGEQQRVALGRAIVRRPAVFLLDEPLSNLDVVLRTEMRRLLADLQRRLATTTVYVTHDQAEALTLGQRIAVMRAGKLEQVGTPAEVYGQPANRFVAGFIGNQPMRLLAGELVDSTAAAERQWTFVGQFGSIDVPRAALEAGLLERLSPASGRRVELGLRAEHVRFGRQVSPGALPVRVVRAEFLGDVQAVELEFRGSGQHQTPGCCVDTKVPICGSILGDGPVHLEEQGWARLALEQACWFDPASGENLLAQSAVNSPAVERAAGVSDRVAAQAL